ncbi:MAG: hypothetical protein AABY00_00695 [Nanoarchaeota archaeon]
MRNTHIYSGIHSKHIEDLSAIDRACFGREPSEQEIRRALRHPHLFTFITHHDNNREQIVGYGLVLPLNRTAHKAIKEGRMAEEEIGSKHIVPESEASGIYIASIASLPYHPKISPLRMVSLRGRIVGYTLGPLLRTPKEVFAIAISHDGESICRETGMVPQEYQGSLQGLKGYTSQLFTKSPLT